MTDRDLTVEQIISLCGGAKAISAASELSVWAVYKWRKIGINERNWDVVTSLSGVTEMEIRKANKKARTAESVAA